jgi:serine/threonine protein kinase/tetratricopeptide (TPR) repeat protein/ActR/RegA family two-component response regulator
MNDQPTPVADDAGRILLVDDDATNLDVLRETLKGQGYRLYVARNGEDALKVARRVRPLIVLLDVVMPGIDGYETCRRLKDDPETLDAAVIFLSALDDAKDKVKGFEAGAVDFITKPFQGDEVLARVKTHLAIQRLLRGQGERAPQRPHAGETIGSPAIEARAPGASVFRTGDVVAFRFRIVRYLAKGGMGELYEAEDLELRERVALKTILSHIADDERSIVLFKREVHLARQVTHPNVCRIYDVFRHRGAAARGAEVVFLAMELLHGETLADKLHRDGRCSTAEILPVLRQMAAGLTAAHRVGVVHRDFKSHNVMLVKPARAEDELRVVVTDFGLAWRSTQDENTGLSMSMSGEGEISGTPAYMAPEQVEGGPVTPATDVYALGVVLYEMVTGVCPFMGETPLKVAIKRLQEAPPSPRVHVPEVDPLWEATILRCLARRPEDRFANAGDVVAALEGRLADRVAEDRRQQSRTRGAWSALVLIVLATLAAGYGVYARYAVPDGRAGLTSLAVLPFRNGSNNPEHEYLSDGISEGLINRLSQLEGLKVVANSSSSRYKGQEADLHEVARALDVAGIVAGRILQRGDSLSISVELIDGRDRTQVWGEQYVRKAADLLQVQGEISRDIARKLPVRLTSGEQQRLESGEIRNPEAYELLLKGHFHRARGGTEDRRTAGEYFTRAIAADPGYALAYADLSDIYRSLVNSGLLDPKEYLPKARAAAHKALELDDNLADAHYALANLLTYSWEWADAEREYTRATALNPNLALAHRWYATYLRIMGRHEQAVAEITRARELDPLSPGVNATVGYVLSSARRYDQAMDALNKTIELDRTYPYTYLFLGHTYAAQGKHADAVAAYQRAMALGLDTPATQVFLGAAYARAGDRERALAVLARLRSSKEHVSAGELAILLAALGQREEAFAALEDAYRAGDIQLQYLGVESGFDPLRQDPRFQNLLQRVGLSR